MQGTNEFFIEILKSASNEKFVASQKVSIDSDDPSAYYEGMDFYFGQNGDLYNKIQTHLQNQTLELQKLQKFEKDVKSGKNKEASMDDFKNFSNKLEDLKCKLQGVEDLIDGEPNPV